MVIASQAIATRLSYCIHPLYRTRMDPCRHSCRRDPHDEFKKMNPNSRIPVLVLANGSILTESNAILNFLAEGSEFSLRSVTCAPRYCSGNSSNSTATNLLSRQHAISISTWACRKIVEQNTRPSRKEGTSPVCDGTTTQSIRLSGRQLTDYRRHQPLCLYPCGTRGRL